LFAADDLSELGFHHVPKALTRANIKMYWPTFKPKFLAFCGEQGKHEYLGGVLASILPNADFLLHLGVAANTVVPPNPGAFNAGDDIHVFKLLSAAYTRYTEHIGSATRIWRIFLDDSLFSTLAHPEYGLARVSLQEQYAHILATEAVTDAALITNVENMLNKPQPQQDLMDVLSRMDAYFHLRSGITAPVSEFDKLKLLQTQWKDHPIYGERILEYFRTHRQLPRTPPVDGDQLYSELVNHLTNEYNLHREVALPVHLALSVTSDSEAHSPASSSAPFPSDASFQSQITALSAQIAALTAQSNVRPRGRAPAAALARKGKFAGPYKYCHSHGEWDHPSNECRNKFAGHKDAATAANKMGGTTGKWGALSDEQKQAKRDRSS
jgi:hypothetical protein